jgi:hypothetical protein
VVVTTARARHLEHHLGHLHGRLHLLIDLLKHRRDRGALRWGWCGPRHCQYQGGQSQYVADFQRTSQ